MASLLLVGHGRDARHERSCRLWKQERVNFGGGGGILRRGERERRGEETEEINKLENETESEMADRQTLRLLRFLDMPLRPLLAFRGRSAGL